MPTVLTNLSALSAQMAQKSSSRSMSTAMQQLSTSKRINQAADDVAGLAISTRLTSRIREVNQTIRNMNDQISLVQVAEGGLEGITNALQRMRELRIQSLNGTSNPADKALIEDEITNLKGDIDRILSTTDFNGIKMLNGDATAPTVIAPPLPPQSGSLPFIVAASATSDIVSVFTPDGKGGLNEQQLNGEGEFSNVPGRVPFYSTSVTIADMNGDGSSDIVTEWNVFTNDGNGSFVKSHTFGPSIMQRSDVSVGDINGDGKPDVLFSDQGAWYTIYTNAGNNSYSFIKYDGSNTLDSILADYNNDGKLDILTGGDYGKIALLKGNGDGTFSFDSAPSVSGRPQNFKLADLNGDGRGDIVSLNTTGYPEYGVAFAYTLQNSDGTFANWVEIPNAPLANRLDVGDLNKDGKIDLVTTNVDSSMSIYVNQGNGTFVQTKIQLPQDRGDTGQGRAKTGVSIEDVNGDGSPDLVIGNAQTNAINIYKNAGDGSFSLLTTITSDHSLDGVAASGTLFPQIAEPTIIEGNSNSVLKYLDKMKLSSLNVADPTLDNIDTFLHAISASRSEVGAYVSRLTARVDSLASESTHAQESQSRIHDTEYSSSTTELAKQQIIQQASTAMLAQANQEPQFVLQLLKSTSS